MFVDAAIRSAAVRPKKREHTDRGKNAADGGAERVDVIKTSGGYADIDGLADRVTDQKR
jgi:hypothetical protein